MRFSSSPFGQNRRRASVLVFSVLVMVAAGFASVSWLNYISHSQSASRRDRARIPAMNEAEGGLEHVINFFNNPEAYVGIVPEEYDEVMKASPYTVTYRYRDASGTFQQKAVPKPGSNTNEYDLFEAYIIDILKNPDAVPVDHEGNVLVDINGDFLEGKEPVVTKFSYLRSRIDHTSSKIPSFTINPADYPALAIADADGADLGEVIELVFLHPKDFTLYGDSPPPAGKRVIGKIVSRGQGDLAVQATVEQILTENNNLQVQSPGAIISHVSADMGAQFNIYWGGVFAKKNIILPSMTGNNKPNNSLQDPYLKIYTEDTLMVGNVYADGTSKSGTAKDPIPADAANYYLPYLDSSAFPNYLHLKQHQQNLPLQKFDYGEWKEFFLSYDLPYYFTGPRGEIYGRERNADSPDHGKIVSKSYSEWFTVSADSPDYWDINGLLAFVDTIPVNDLGETKFVNGVPVIDDQYYPREPGTTGAVMATISHSGGSDHTRGFILLVANLDFSGTGNPPQADTLLGMDGEKYFRNPEGDIPTNNEIRNLGHSGPLRISHNGLLYMWGSLNLTGERTIYGSVVAEGGYTGNGTPDVFYNYRLGNGTFLNINQSLVKRDTWALRTVDVPEIGG